MKRIRIALVGDFNENKHTHLALNNCVAECKGKLPFELDAVWTPTQTIGDPATFRQNTDGLWIAPGSPYENDEAVYRTIQWARENNFPILGICGGFQYMVVEYARNVLGISDAGHEESDPQVPELVISKLSCSLKGQQGEVIITDKQSWLYQVLKKDTFTGFFNCNYGVNPLYAKKLDQYPFVFTAFDPSGEVRALELKGHRFFKGTLFQPPLDSTPENPNPLIMSFLNHCAS